MDAIHGMIGNAAQHFPKIEVRVQTVKLGGPDQRIDPGCPFSSFIRAGKRIISSP
jgi:hypothetical protein